MFGVSKVGIFMLFPLYTLYNADLGQWNVKEVGADDVIKELCFVCVSLARCLKTQEVCPKGVQGPGWEFATYSSGDLHVTIAYEAPEARMTS